MLAGTHTRVITSWLLSTLMREGKKRLNSSAATRWGDKKQQQTHTRTHGPQQRRKIRTAWGALGTAKQAMEVGLSPSLSLSDLLTSWRTRASRARAAELLDVEHDIKHKNPNCCVGVFLTVYRVTRAATPAATSFRPQRSGQPRASSPPVSPEASVFVLETCARV